MDERSLRIEDEPFSDIYVYDKGVKERIQGLIDGEECVQLVEKAKDLGSTLPLLDEMVPDKKARPIKEMLPVLKPFYDRAEYRTKEDYLQYLKQAYGFMLCPLEVPPGRILSVFYPGYKRGWKPSQESAVELLKKFYVEVALINELTPAQWKDVASATNPEAVLAKMLYGTKFKGDFEDFLGKIPWILSRDVYSSPGLDMVYRMKPGQEMPKKPFGVGEGFLKNLVKSSRDNRAYILLADGENTLRLGDKGQITDRIEGEGSARIDTFVGLSKIERDFVVHQRIIIWQNPGFEKYRKASLFDRIRYVKPSRYLCVIREQALPLDIPFLERKLEDYRR